MRFSLPNLRSKKERRDDSEPSRLEKHWGTLISLTGIFILALFIRSYFSFSIATDFGTPYLLSGGSDAYYYGRIIEYIQTHNRHLVFDPLLNYPMGHRNPRPPIYAWSVVLMGYLIRPFVGNLNQAINYSFMLSTGFWGALTIFPVYLIGRDTFGKKAGMTAAFLLAISSGHLQRSAITNGDHDALYLFFAVTAFYFFMKALEGIPEDRYWVEDWGDFKKVKIGLRDFLKENKKQLLYAGMAGMGVATVALTWKGFAYLVVVILAYYFLQLFIDKFREKDSLGVTACVGVSLGLAFLVAMPFYLSTGVGTSLPSGLAKWFDVPLVIFLAGLTVGILFTITRDWPWLLIFSILAAAITIFVIVGVYIAPSVLKILTSGAGYFTRTKPITTIAEAQAPEFSNLVLSFGMVSFFLSVAGIGLAVWNLKGNWTTNFMFILIWTALAIYMAMSAARFIFNSSPAFALTAGWIIALVVDKTNFKSISRRVKGMRGDILLAIWKSVKVKHVLTVLFVVFLLMIPNALYALDAGMPYDEKTEYNEQIHESLPKPLQAKGYNASSGNNWYLGGFGYALDKPTQYWPAAWDWLKERDEDLPPEERPGFLSWWDYGFECTREARHPTVADNFLNGHQVAGNILMAQNESEILGLFISRMIEEPYVKGEGFKGSPRDILVDYIGEDKVEEIEETYNNPAEYKDEVLSNPERYHPRAEDIRVKNVQYVRTMGLLSYEDLDTLVELYRDLSINLDKRIRYISVDSRLFPFSGRQTGIFYAPAKLSGHRVSEERGMRAPSDFYTIKLVGEKGKEYEDPEEVPPDVSIQDYKIDYKPAFFNTTLYRTFVGYSAQQVDQGEGVPGLDKRKLQPMPGWNMSHFRLAYKTAYYNPYPEEEARDHPEAWQAVSFDKAAKYKEEKNGTVDLSARSSLRQGVVFLEYFDGAMIEGKVTTDAGKPMPNTRVTVIDERGTPHDQTYTDENGEYEIKGPYGNLTLIASNGGGGNKLTQTESIQLGATGVNVTREQSMRKKVDRDMDGKWDYLIDKDIEVKTGNLTGHVYIDEDNDGEFSYKNDTQVESTVKIKGDSNGVELTAKDTNGTFSFRDIAPGKYTISSEKEGTSPLKDISLKPGKEVEKDIKVATSSVKGNISLDEGIDISEVNLTLSREGSQKNYTAKIVKSGNYSFEQIVPGRYILGVKSDDYIISEGEVSLDVSGGKDISRNVSVTQSEMIRGDTLLKEGPLTYQTLSFIDLDDRSFSVTSDGSGEFEIKLPKGRYMVYGLTQRDEKKFVHMGSVSTSDDAEYKADFTKAYQLEGNVTYNNNSAEGFKGLITKGSGERLLVSSNSKGYFSTYLPTGDYHVYGWKAEGVISRFGFRSFSIGGSEKVDIELSDGIKIDGVTYRELNLNGQFDKGEGISSGIKIGYKGKETTLWSKEDGNYTIILPKGKSDVSFTKKGFIDEDYEFAPRDVFQEKVSLRATNVTVEGNVSFDKDIPIPDSLPITFEPRGNGAIRKKINVSEGYYNTSLQPGDYRIEVEHTPSDGVRYSFREGLSIEPTEGPVKKAIDVDYLVKIKGEIRDQQGNRTSADISFLGPDRVNITANKTYVALVRPGNYSYRALNEEKEISANKRVEISSPRTIDLNLSEGIVFSPIINYKDEPRNNIPIWIESLESDFKFNKTTNVDGTFRTVLNPGKYKVSVDYRTTEPIEGILREVHYHYSDIYNFKTSTTPEIELNRDMINATLEGKVLVKGEGVSGVKVELIENSPDAISTSVVTGEDGTFEVEVSRGLYTVYSAYSGEMGLRADLHDFAMPEEEDETLNINLSKAVRITGKVEKGGEGLPANITFRRAKGVGEKKFSTDDNGNYDVILPEGEYDITASTTFSDPTGETTFKKSKRADLQNSKEMDFELRKVKRYGMEIDPVSTRKVEPGDSVIYHIPIKNTGNTIDEFEFSARQAVWDVKFTPSRFSIGPGISKNVRVSVDLPEDASVNHPPISFKVSSNNSDQSSETRLPIQVKQYHGVDISPSVDKMAFNNGVLTYTINVENTGNGKDSYQIDVINKGSLRSNGWEVSTPNSTGEITGGGQKKIDITLKAVSADPNYKVNIEILAVSQDDEGVSEKADFKAQLPKVSSNIGNFSIKGEKLALEEEEFQLKTWHWVSLVILVSMGALYYMRRKRWI